MIGFTPQQVNAMTLWQFGRCIDGWNRSQGGGEAIEPPSEDEFEAALAAMGRD